MRHIEDAIAHAKEEYPRESVGFFYVHKGKMRYHAAVNISPEKDRFMVSAEETAQVEAKGEIVALVHSHPDTSPLPSLLDQSAHAVSGLEWVIIGLIDGVADVHTMPAMTEAVPLMGRTFIHGVTDCYTFIRDWYKQEFSLDLPDFARADKWWELGQNLYVENFEAAGFVAVDDMQYGDVLLMTIGASVANHGAVYVGDGLIEHHLYSRLSCREVFGQFYRDRVRYVVRHNTRA